MAKKAFVCLVVLMSVLLSSCIDPVTPTTVASPTRVSSNLAVQEEAAPQEAPTATPAPLTEEQFEAIRRFDEEALRSVDYAVPADGELDELRRVIREEDDVAFEAAKFSLQGDSPSVPAETSRRLLIPVSVITLNELRSFATGFQEIFGNGPASSLFLDDEQWKAIFHFTSHAQELGLSPRDVGAITSYMQTVLQGATSGNGLVLYRAASASAQEAYMFLGKIGNDWWCVLLDPHGSPITTFSANATEVKYAAKMIKRGWVEVGPSGVPDAIRTNWLEGTPSTVKLWWWMFRYKICELAKSSSVTTAITSWLQSLQGIATGETLLLLWIIPPQLLVPYGETIEG